MTKLPQDTPCHWLLVKGTELYLPNNEIPFGRAEQFGFSQHRGVEIRPNVWLVQAEEADNAREFVGLRSQLFQTEETFKLLNQAVSLNDFFVNHRFCGVCGGKMQYAQVEMALNCTACQKRIYPTISPAIIVAVRKGRQILLANHQRHKGTIYTTLAGFMEAGEAIEDTVHREVWEESKIKINNLRYFGSQPWAFPNSLMVGFLADYESGEITLQEQEIFDAKWFSCDAPLPELPPEGTIARKLIMATLEICRQD